MLLCEAMLCLTIQRLDPMSLTGLPIPQSSLVEMREMWL